MAVCEKNRLFHCFLGGPYHDFYSSRDSVIRENYYYEVNQGPYQNLGGSSVFDPNNPLKAASLSNNGLVATFVVQNQPFPTTHDLKPGEVVLISGADQPWFNGYFRVETAPSNTVFTYKFNEIPPVSQGSATGTPIYRRFWQIGQLTIENNVLDLGLNIHPLGVYQPIGVAVGNVNNPGFQCCKRLFVRDNWIGTVDQINDPIPHSFGIAAHTCEQAFAERNTILLNQSYPVKFQLTKGLTQENNRPGGIPITGLQVDGSSILERDETLRRVETAFVTAFL